jgi:hypothetical protein
MGHEAPRPVQHEGIARRADLDGRDHVPDQLQVHLGDNHADRRTIAGYRNRHVGLGVAIIADFAVPEPVRAGSRHGLVGRAIGSGLGSVQADARDIETLPSVAVEKREADDGRYLPQQTQGIDAPPLVRFVGPGELDQPAELVGDAVEKALDLGARRPRLDPQKLVERRPLVAIAEPGLADAIGRQRNDHGQKQHEEIFLKQAAEAQTLLGHERFSRSRRQGAGIARSIDAEGKATIVSPRPAAIALPRL